MKKVIIMRHSKSSWDSSKINDIDRSLNERGLNDATVMGKFLLNNKIIPDLIICSIALRTRMTYDLILDELNLQINTDFNPVLYDNNTGNIIKLIAETDEKINNLMIIGHNPSMQELVECFINGDFPYSKFSTSGIAVINFNISSWHEITDSYGELESYKTPKMIKPLHN